MGVARSRHGTHVAPIRAALTILGVLVGIAILAAAWIIRAPLPKLDGSIDVPGIRSEVTIRRDGRGIPHIEASSAADAFYGQGFACAQDRLWQMDILRREAEGKLSELFGPVALSVDEYYRTVGIGAIAQAAADGAPSAEREVLDAYAAGVNAAASTRPLPLEFRLLGYKPQQWTPADTLAVGLLITKQQDDNWKDELLRADIAAKVGVPAARALMDKQIPSLEEYMPGYGPASAANPGRSAANGIPPVDWASAAGVDSPPLADHQGSNNWTVAASRTTTGKPVLSNDTHLDHTLPSTWWLSQVEGGGYDVEGFTLPGLPGVIIGHNRRIAFGVTSAAEDVEDLFVERFRSATSDRYLADGKWLAARHRTERIGVKGKPPVVLDVLETRHGPIVKRSGSSALALSWTILREGSSVTPVLDWDRALDWTQFRTALSELVGPTLNFAYADVDGHIGYQDAGRVPARSAGDGSMPVEGQDDRYAWTGDVPFDVLPHALDPKRGFLATANNAVVPPSFSPVLSRDYLPPYRIHEIVTRLSVPAARTPEEIGAIQADDVDYPRSRLAQVAEPILAASTSRADRDLATTLSAWNGDAAVDATAPTFLAALDRALQDRLLKPVLGSALLARYDAHQHLLNAIVRALDGDASLAKIGITRATVLRTILPAAHDAEQTLKYPEHPLQRWGDANAAVYEHPLAVAWPLTLLNAPPIAQPGDPYTVFQSRPDFGPSQRLVADTSDWDRSSMLLTLGESGVWTDPHYTDMERDWAAVNYVPTPFSDGAVEKAAADTLHLEPSGP
jgi:penicillin G amidase